jgi:two-component system chemotaxis response regulator CheB
MLGDGSAGLLAIKRAGGVAIVQDPEEAVFSAMPLNAIQTVAVDHVLPVSQMANVIRDLSLQPVPENGGAAMPKEFENERETVHADMARFETGETPFVSSVLTCPECGGVMWEIQEGELARYRCHVGHVFSGESLMEKQGETLEAALWTAVRTLEERAALLRRMAARFHGHGSQYSGTSFSEQADDAERNADVIRDLLLIGRRYASADQDEGAAAGAD